MGKKPETEKTERHFNSHAFHGSKGIPFANNNNKEKKNRMIVTLFRHLYTQTVDKSFCFQNNNNKITYKIRQKNSNNKKNTTTEEKYVFLTNAFQFSFLSLKNKRPVLSCK